MKKDIIEGQRDRKEERHYIKTMRKKEQPKERKNDTKERQKGKKSQ